MRLFVTESWEAAGGHGRGADGSKMRERHTEQSQDPFIHFFGLRVCPSSCPVFIEDMFPGFPGDQVGASDSTMW